MVSRDLAKVEIAGSNPVSRSNEMAFRPFFVGAEDSKAIFILDLFLKKKYYFLLTHEVLLGIL